jgi:hypothetical protein
VQELIAIIREPKGMRRSCLSEDILTFLPKFPG